MAVGLLSMFFTGLDRRQGARSFQGWASLSESPKCQQNPMQERVGIGGATGNIDIHWDDHVHAAEAGVVLAEDAATAAAGADGHYQSWRGCGVIGLAQREFHVAGNRAGDQ